MFCVSFCFFVYVAESAAAFVGRHSFVINSSDTLAEELVLHQRYINLNKLQQVHRWFFEHGAAVSLTELVAGQAVLD